jgi:hypothetical protein
MRVRETVPGKYVDIWLDNGTWITVFERKDGDQDGTLMIGVNSAKGEVGTGLFIGNDLSVCQTNWVGDEMSGLMICVPTVTVWDEKRKRWVVSEEGGVPCG